MYVELAILLVLVLLAAVAFVRQKYSFWSSRNVPFLEPKLLYGNFKDFDRLSVAEVAANQYNQMKHKGRFFGLYFFLEPIMMVSNLDLIKTLLIKDFNFLPDRGIYHNVKDDPMSGHLFSLEGDKWRSLRSRLTPTFTSGKMKMMFTTVKEIGDRYSEYLTKSVGGGREVEIKDFASRFTIDVISSCALGIEANSFVNPNNEFRNLGKRIIDHPMQSTTMRTFLRLFPEWGLKLRIRVNEESGAAFFYKLVEDTIRHRRENSVVRNDFLRLLMDMQDQLTMDEIAAQVFVIFGAGFETSSSNQSYCLYELARNPECQQRARESVLKAIEKHGGLTYEAVNDMQYLDQCINETLRLYPSLPILERRTAQSYQIPDTNVTIPKNLKIHIPIFAIHRDGDIFPNPLAFDPDRFLPEEVAKRHAFAFLPFGEGPRTCIGLRFGRMQSRMGLAMLLSKFRVSPCPRTAPSLQFTENALVLQPKEDIWLKMEPL